MSTFVWTTIWLTVGSIGGLIFVAYARDHGLRGQLRIYALGLVVAAAIYVVLAALGGSVRWVGIEVLGVLVFAGIAALGLGMTPLWLAFGWAVHAVWDAGLHLFRQSGVVGTWYPIACIPFDLIVAVAIVLYAVRADHDSLHRL